MTSSAARGDNVVKYIQVVLLFIGAPALGVVSCGFGLMYLASGTVFHTRLGQDPSLDWNGAIGSLGCGFCGGTFGAIAGLVGALRWISRRGREPWTSHIWIGVVLGLVVALAIRFSGFEFGGLIRGWPGIVLYLAASGTFGGLIGGVTSSDRARQRRPRKRNRRY